VATGVPSSLVHGLRELRVVELSTGIAGAYCTKLLADAGADVIKVEPPEGDPLRRWSATGAELGGEDGALFRFLAASKRSLVGGPADAAVLELAAGADLVVESCAPGAGDGVLDWPARFPGLVLLSISPFGRGGPWRARAATEFTVQAESGSIGSRGLPGGEPFQAGGRITEWVAGTYAAVGALAAVQRARRSGHGEHVDFSLLEVMNVAGSNYMDLFWSLFGREPRGAAQTVETPSIEPTADGYVGFCTNSRQQFSDFLLLIDRPELRDDPALAQVAGRLARFAEWSAIVSGWTRRHTTAEVVERASLLRIPVAPVCNGDTVRRHEQLVARGVFQKDPSGSFLAPRPPWKLDGESPPPPRPAPRLGENGGRVEPRPPRRPAAPVGERRLPLAGLRVLDATAWWAGPSATHMLACLGADVIHLESIQRPDGMRMMASAFGGRERWWEWSAFYLAANTNKRGLALNLADPRGVALAKRLIARCDAVVENFTPRVMDGFGLTWEAIRAASPRCIYVRMPAFGLDGPWRDHTGFAQTMEQITGLAWVTGHRDDQPRIQRGPCDPLAGMHAAFALLVALEERERTGRGAHVECTMVEGALNAAAEQLVEYTASGRLLQREGNRAPGAAPQGLYPCRGHDPAASPRWLALSVETDGQWSALVRVLGEPAWAREPAFASHRGRRAAHDALDTGLRRWAAERELDAAVAELLAAGVPAASVADPRTTQRNPQLAARGFYEQVAHPVVGAHALPTLPFRYASVPRWLRSPAPTLGQHGREILRELASASAEELEELAAAGVIGERPEGA
jgi:crotonobetainyl-CoA:carnitine CoA-transferase CaiB-like acyl-CoA transferase